MTQLSGLVKKGWGSEFIWVTNDKYCGKFLNFEEGKCFSMHFHKDKEETWYVQSGGFIVETIDTNTAEIKSRVLREGDVHHNPPLLPHRIRCVKAGTILEISTPDSVEDNYRVMPGDSQNV